MDIYTVSPYFSCSIKFLQTNVIEGKTYYRTNKGADLKIQKEWVHPLVKFTEFDICLENLKQILPL